jgi:hypothetical protein
MLPFFRKTLVRSQQIRSYEVTPSPTIGWEVFEHSDQVLVRRQTYRDWHRVERIVTLWKREIAELQDQGWRES